MSKLEKAIKAAIEKYDNAEDDGDAAFEDAAHECIAEIRLALEAVPVNFNNPIAKLQERAQAEGLPMPEYRFTQTGEPHIPKMTCICTSEGIEATASGKNKQTAKRRAAAVVLEGLLNV